MKWFMALNSRESSIKHSTASARYEFMALAALASAKKNAPQLEPHLIYNGLPNQFTDRVRELGCELIFHQLSVQSLIDSVSDDFKAWKHISRGALLRIDIPNIVDCDEVVLYTDVDVIFLKDPSAFVPSVNTFALAPEQDVHDYGQTNINSGVMFLNPRNVRSIFDELKMRYALSINEICRWGYFDQEIIRFFLNGKWEKLHQFFNWKPYWGIHEDAVIIHFHGPKPFDCDLETSLLQHEGEVYKRLYGLNSDAYQYYLSIWKHYFLMQCWNK